MFAIGGVFATAHPPGADHAPGRPGAVGDLQQALHHARRGDGLLLPDPVHPGRARELPHPDHDRGQGPGLPAHQPAELVHLHRWAPPSRCTRCVTGGVDTGWTFYAPYSTHYSNTHVIAAGLGIFITGFSSILTGLNFIVTIHKMRAPGLTWFRLPLFVWAHYATSLIMILGTPVIAVTLLMVALERASAPRDLRPRPGRRPGAVPAPVLVLLAPGRLHHDPARHGRDQRARARASPASGSSATASWPSPASPSPCSGFLVWGHHMFVSGQSTYAGLVFSGLSFLVAIPSAVKVFNWTATLYKGSISLRHADALRARLHRPLHHRRPDRPLPGRHGPRRARARHLLRGRALPLHHGGRRDHGLPGRPALLVAQDHRAACTPRLGRA